jgi:dTDP-4-dehydrorhamnose reductase
MKTVIIGADCRLGLELAANLQGRDIPFVSISSRDPVLDSVKLLLHAFAYHGATQVVNALSHELFSGDDPAAYKRSLLVTKNLCKACRAHEAALIHLSDDSMYAGRKSGAYREKDKPDSADPRVARVLKAESYVNKRAPKHIVLRCGPLFAPAGHNLFTMLAAQLEKGHLLECTEDKLCPTPANDIARVVVAIILQLDCGAEPWGTYNYCSSDASSLYNFAEAVVALASQYGRIRRDEVRLQPVPGKDRNVILNCHHILNTFGIKQRPWRAALPAVVAEYCRS